METHANSHPLNNSPRQSPNSLFLLQYVEELWRKKQSDVMRFLLRVRCWENRQWPGIVRLTRPSRPEKARKLGYKAKQGIVIYRVRIKRGNRRRAAPKVSTPRTSRKFLSQLTWFPSGSLDRCGSGDCRHAGLSFHCV